MSNGWEKYFEQNYNIQQQQKEPVREGLFFGGLCFLVTLGLFIHLNAKGQNTEELNIPFSTSPSLKQKIEILEAQNSMLESQILIWNHKFTALLEKKTDKFLDRFNPLLAIKETKGEGVIIKLNDSTKPITFGENPNLMIVHNLDLLSIVNELWGSGAKAISVNDQRITASTEFNCIGPMILINNTRVLPPFEIKAVGDPELLYQATAEGYVKKYKLEKYGIQLDITKSEEVTVPASSSTLLANLKR